MCISYILFESRKPTEKSAAAWLICMPDLSAHVHARLGRFSNSATRSATGTWCGDWRALSNYSLAHNAVYYFSISALLYVLVYFWHVLTVLFNIVPSTATQNKRTHARRSTTDFNVMHQLSVQTGVVGNYCLHLLSNYTFLCYPGQPGDIQLPSFALTCLPVLIKINNTPMLWQYIIIYTTGNNSLPLVYNDYTNFDKSLDMITISRTNQMCGTIGNAVVQSTFVCC